MTASASLPRAGQLNCVCGFETSEDDAPEHHGTVGLLAVAFSLSVLSQVLILSILPLAGLSLAPSRGWASLPYGAFYAGAAVASLPASLLLDAFGRRAAFSLGASLGTAGGLVLAWSLTQWHFGALVLGSFWLGVAGGFSLFYRHAAAGLGRKGKSALLVVFGAASLAGLAAPTLADIAETLALPHVFVGVAVAAALAHVGSLAVTAALPYQRRRTDVPQGARARWSSIFVPTLIGALGWFMMTALMGATPITMVGCGLSEAVVGAVAWHVIAMYAPSLLLAGLPVTFRPVWVTCSGCLLLVGAGLAFTLAGSKGAFSVSVALLGVGWSLVTLGTTLWIHQDGTPSRGMLGLHDGALFGGALLGALSVSVLT